MISLTELKLNHLTVIISLEVPPPVPPPPSSMVPSNDCKVPVPSVEEQGDSFARLLSWFSLSCSETRSWSGPRSGPDPSRAVVFFFRLNIDSPRIPSSTWPVVRHWTLFSDVSLRGCRCCPDCPISSPFSCVDLQHGGILTLAAICQSFH